MLSLWKSAQSAIQSNNTLGLQPLVGSIVRGRYWLLGMTVVLGALLFPSLDKFSPYNQASLMWVSGLLLAMVIIGYFSRSWRLTWIPIVATSLGCTIVFSLSEVFGWNGNLLLSHIHWFILSFVTIYCVHIGCAYQHQLAIDESKKGALARGTVQAIGSSLITSLCCLVLLVPLAASTTPTLLQLSIVSIFSILIAFTISFYLTPAILSFGKKPISAMNRYKKDWVDVSLEKMADSVIAKPKRWMIGYSVFSLLVSAGIVLLEGVELERITRSILDSHLGILGGITLVLIVWQVVFSSFVLSVFCLLSVCMPIAVTLGAMGWSDFVLSTPLLLFATLLLASALDNSIQFLLRFKDTFKQNNNYQRSVHSAIIHVGRPLVFTTTILSSAYSVFTLSIDQHELVFGYLSGIFLSWALLASLIWLPVMVLLVRPSLTLRRVHSKENRVDGDQLSGGK